MEMYLHAGKAARAVGRKQEIGTGASISLFVM